MKRTFPYEIKLQAVIFPDLIRGREDFDLPHTQAVVYWMKQILNAEVNLSFKVLITAAYAHDWGYIDLGITKTASISQIHDVKAEHMRVGAARINKLLRTQFRNDYSQAQIDRITHLVFIHDRLDKIRDEDEVALVEADTLGALDVDRVKPTFSQKDNEKYLKEQVMKIRRPLFRHKKAIKEFERLYLMRERFYSGTISG